jgi:hypothetical protein
MGNHMDQHKLEQLADRGFRSVGLSELEPLGLWCRDRCEHSGDGRYCLVGETLCALADWWEECDERGGVPSALLSEIEAELMGSLRHIIFDDDFASAAMAAGRLRRSIQVRLLAPTDWRAYGVFPAE